MKQSLETDRQVRNARGRRSVTFEIEDTVWTKNFCVNEPPWTQAVVKNKLGPVTYLVELISGKLIKQHLDQLRRTGSNVGENIDANGTDRETGTSTLRRSARIKKKGMSDRN